MINSNDVCRHPDGKNGLWIVRCHGWRNVEVRDGYSVIGFLHNSGTNMDVLFPIDKDGSRVELKPKPLKVGDFVVHKPTLTWGVIAVAQPGFADAKVLLFGPTSAQLVRVVVSDIERSDPIEIQRDAIRELRETINNATSAFASKY